MRLMGLLLKMWAGISLLAAIVLSAIVFHAERGLTLSLGDQLIDGPMAVLGCALVLGFLVFAAGLLITLLLGVVGVLVPATLLLAVAALCFGLGAAGIVVLGSCLLAASPVLIVVAGCVLLLRGLRDRRRVLVAPISSLSPPHA